MIGVGRRGCPASDRGDVDGLGPLGPGLRVEGHPRALAQRPEPVGDYARVMDEVVGALVIRGDEAKALVVVEPLHGAGSQGSLSVARFAPGVATGGGNLP